MIWLKANKLSLNLTKLRILSVIFHPGQKKVKVYVPLILENTTIKQVVETKFLGDLIHQRLSWKTNPALDGTWLNSPNIRKYEY